MVIVMLSGWAGSGKDTLAKQMIDEISYSRVAFADVLKDMVAEQYDITRESLDDRDQKESPILRLPVESKDAFSMLVHEYMYREFRTAEAQRPLDYIHKDSKMLGFTKNKDGSDVGIYSNGQQLFWTPRALAILEGSVKRSANSNYWVDRAVKKALENNGGNVVITDFRYKSEYEGVKLAAAKNGIKVITVRINRFSETKSQDSSERDLDDFVSNYTIKNTGTVEQFLKEGKDLIRKISYNEDLSSWG